MKLRSARRPVVIATAAFAVLALGLTGTAAAKAFITSADIADNTIRTQDIRDATITSDDIRNGTVTGQDIAGSTIDASDIRSNAVGSSEIAAGAVGSTEIANGAVGSNQIANGAVGSNQIADAAVNQIQNGVFVGEHWGVQLRNTKGSASADLRMGPFAGTTVQPPLGTGSLQLLTGDNASQISFGNEVDFAGKNLASILGNAAGFSVYVTGEDLTRYKGNAPSIKLEIDPNVDGTASNYGTLNFTVTKTLNANDWTAVDATNPDHGFWWLTGAAGTAIKCTQAAGENCTFDQIKSKLANADVLTLGVGKGTDYAFQGAVDALRIGNTVFDFEARGVFARNA